MRFLSLLLFAACLLNADGRNTNQTSRYTIGPSIQPMVIIGEGWTQQFTFINVDYYESGEATKGMLYFFTHDGKPWKIPLRNHGLVDRVEIELQPGRMAIIDTEILWKPQELGWAYFDLPLSLPRAWGIYRAFSVYRKQTPDRPDFMTSVPMVDGLEDNWAIPFDNEGGKYPGIALVNTSSSEQTTFTLKVVGENGSEIKTITKVVQPLHLHWFSLVHENLDLAEKRGQIRVTSAGGIYNTAVLSLQFAPNGAFTALPMVHTFGMPK